VSRRQGERVVQITCTMHMQLCNVQAALVSGSLFLARAAARRVQASGVRNRVLNPSVLDNTPVALNGG
jgi:hypothetical protein